MEFFTSAIDTLKVLVIALGAGLGVWGVIITFEEKARKRGAGVVK